MSVRAYRAQERIELELINGRQMWPAAVGNYTRSEHCEGHFAGWCIFNYLSCFCPCLIESAIGGCCDCCCCYTAHRRKKLRDRYKLKGSVCTDYLVQCPMWCVVGGCAINSYQEVCPLTFNPTVRSIMLLCAWMVRWLQEA